MHLPCRYIVGVFGGLVVRGVVAGWMTVTTGDASVLVGAHLDRHLLRKDRVKKSKID